MSTTPPAAGRARPADDVQPESASRSADVVQADISALLRETGGWLWGPTRERYEELRDEWIAAKRGEMTTAA